MITRKYKVCPQCGREFAIGGFAREDEYQGHWCVPQRGALGFGVFFASVIAAALWVRGKLCR